VDRHRRHLALRRLRLQPGRHPHRPGQVRHRRAVKVWEKREFRNLDDTVELGTRNIKVALRRLRRFAREGAAEELDLRRHHRSTARNAGLLDSRCARSGTTRSRCCCSWTSAARWTPRRVCEELFSAARGEFKHLEYFYFHNFVYEGVEGQPPPPWRAHADAEDLLHTYPPDYKVIFVGDATMSPYEIMPGRQRRALERRGGRRVVWMHGPLRH
jgi:uncharacterized protein